MKLNTLQFRKVLYAALFVLLSMVGMTNAKAQGSAPTGAINGLFSVSDSTQVYFSQGNLQYIGSAATPYWKFADHQWVRLDGQNNNSQGIDRDMFCWGTSGYNHGAGCYQPWSTNDEYANYYVYGDAQFNLYDQTGQADWGYNAILNGGNTENSGWRTLTPEEWQYVFSTRSTASGIRWAKASVNGVNGLVLLPDNWDSSIYALNNTNGGNFSSNTITSVDWTNILEPNGAIFLPTSGYRSHNSIYDRGSAGYYWSASHYNNYYVWHVRFGTDWLLTAWDGYGRPHGLSVRLVRALQDGLIGINATSNPEEGGTIEGTGGYNEGQTCTLTATANAGYTFINWTENGEVVSTDPTYLFTVTGDRTLVANFVSAGTNVTQGVLNGVFSVGENTTVRFSQGNLQYIGSAGNGDENNTGAYWKFAEHQWDYLGDNGQGSDSKTVDRDLFGWGTSGYNHGANCYQPWSTSTSYSDYYAYSGDTNNLFDQTGQADWGYNAISNGGNQENSGWRTLTFDEWDYVFNTRTMVNGGPRYTLYRRVEGVLGVVVYPDNYAGSAVSSDLTAEGWAEYEAAGCVFLPAAGFRFGTSVDNVGSYGYYWSALYRLSNYAYSMIFNDFGLGTDNSRNRDDGLSVRLARVAENYSFNINATPNPAEGGAVSGAGAYAEGTECTLTATAAEGYTFIDWTENGEVVSTENPYTFTVSGDRDLVANFTGEGFLIVNDGSATNGYVPVYGFYTDAYLKSETVYPADELGAMAESTINGMSFFATQANVSWGNASFQVFLKEVDETTISAFTGWDGATIVYEGSLSISNGVMDIVFSTPYYYNGGNLLLGVYNTVQGSFVTSTWYGETVDGASVQGYSYNGLDAINPTQRNFIPKTKFTFDANGSVSFYSITATSNPAEGGFVTGEGSFAEGSMCTLTATANAAYTFINWTENGEVVSTEATYSFTVTENRDLTANFTQDIPNISIPTEGLIAYYPFNGNANDESGNGNHGVLGGANGGPALTTDRFGNENSCFEFGGYYNKNWIDVANSSSLQLDTTVSVSFWVQECFRGGMDGWGSFNTEGYNYGVIAKGGDGWSCPPGLWIYTSHNINNEEGFYGTTANNSYSYGNYAIHDITAWDSSVGDCDWIHCVVIIEGHHLTFYHNGVMVMDTIMENSADFSAANNQDMHIGIEGGHYWNPRDGKLDDICIYNRALTPQEVKLLYGVNDGLIAYYPFDGDANDYSGNEYHATPYNNYQYEDGIVGDCIAVEGQGYTGSSGGHVMLPQLDFGTSTGVTLNLWVNALGLSSSDGEAYINFGSDTETDRLYIMHHLDQIRFVYHDAEISIPNEDSYVGNWVMYSLTLDENGTLKAYVNGILVGEESVTFNGINTSLAALGRHWWSGTTYTRFIGSFDEVRIYKRALSLEEVNMLYVNNRVEITAMANPAEGGSVSGAEIYSHGDICALTATENEGYTFVNWTENGEVVSTNTTYSFTVTGGRNLVANFELNSYDITAVVTPSVGGTVTGVGTYNHFEACTLTATANECYTFVNWTENGEEVSTNTTYSFTVTGGRNLVANFELNSYDITAVATPSGGGAVTGAGTYYHFETCTLTATANEGFLFVNWTENGIELSTNPEYSFTVTGERNFLANFINIQSTVLNGGWTWYSTYVELNGLDGLQMMEEGLDANGIMIKSHVDGFVTYDAGMWMGSLNGVNNESMYLVNVSAPCVLNMIGDFAAPEQHLVTLAPGWTWMGYPSALAVDVNEALSNLNSYNNDIIKSQNGFAAYDESIGWSGTLNTLIPGNGLMYYFNGDQIVNFAYQESSKGGELRKNITADGNRYVPLLSAYPYNMNMIAVVELDGTEARNTNLELAAFVGNECRGSVRLLYVEALDRYMAFLTIFGIDDDALTMRLVDTETGIEYVCEQDFVFEINDVIGSLRQPVVLRFNATTTQCTTYQVCTELYPNPVKVNKTMKINMDFDDKEAKIEIVNALGAVVSTEMVSSFPASVKAPKVPGIYIVKMMVNNYGNYVYKLIVE